MKVSVSITTYNHENYIGKAIESALNQVTSFNYEIIIGEDNSDDQTRNIVKTYQEMYPDIIRLFLNDRKNVIYINGRPTGRWNFLNNLKNARGEFIALLEGDDYWTDPYKLHKQVNFLDSHAECVLSFHDALIKNDETDEFSDFFKKQPEVITNIKNLLFDNYIPTSSVLFRNHLITQFPDWYFSLAFGDWPLYILLAQHGQIGFISDKMSVYRIHPNSYWSLMPSLEKINNTISFREAINAHLNYQYDEILLKEALNEVRFLSGKILQESKTYGDSIPEKELMKFYKNRVINNSLHRKWKISYKASIYQELVYSSWVNGTQHVTLRYWWRLLFLRPLLITKLDYWKIGVKSFLEMLRILRR